MKLITLDIETTAPGYSEIDMVPTWPEARRGLASDGETTREPRWESRKRFPPLPLHVPEVICWLNTEVVVGEHVFDMQIFDASEEGEASALDRLAKDIKAASRLVSWNGRGFDMPLLNLRAMKFGVDWSFWEGLRHRFPNFKKPLFHYDMQDQLGDYGAARSISLDRTSKLIGLPGKVGIDGGGVAEAIERGNRRKVVAYCCNDVFETYMVYLAYAKSHLWSSVGAIDRVMEEALQWAKTNEYLREFY